MTKTLKKCGKMLKDLISIQNNNSMFLHPITNNELINVINTLKNGSVGGEDGVTVDAVKQGLFDRTIKMSGECCFQRWRLP